MQYVHIIFQVFHNNMRSLYLSIFIWSDIYFISYSVLPTICFKYHVMYLYVALHIILVYISKMDGYLYALGHVSLLYNVIQGIKTGSGGVCCHNARGRVRNRKSNPEDFSPRDLTYCSHKPECIVATNPDRSI